LANDPSLKDLQQLLEEYQEAQSKQVNNKPPSPQVDSQETPYYSSLKVFHSMKTEGRAVWTSW
jgi:hypothetical protein